MHTIKFVCFVYDFRLSHNVLLCSFLQVYKALANAQTTGWYGVFKTVYGSRA